MGMEKVRGSFDPITVAIVVACFVVGALCMVFTKKIDSPIEQAAEAVLHVEGIDVDFSAEKKAEEAKEAEANK